MQKVNFKSFGELMKKERPVQKAPAYEWQELALNIIKEFEVPANKKKLRFSGMQKISKNHS